MFGVHNQSLFKTEFLPHVQLQRNGLRFQLIPSGVPMLDWCTTANSNRSRRIRRMGVFRSW